MKKPAAKTARQEDLLLDYVRQASGTRKGRYAVHVKMSSLQRHYQQQSWLIEAARSWHIYKHNALGELYKLSNNDYVVIFPEESSAEVERAVLGLMRVFRDDPVVLRAEQGEGDIFAEWFDFEKDYETFLAKIETFATGTQTTPSAAPAAGQAPAAAAQPAVQTAKAVQPPPARAVLPPATIEDLPSLLRAIGREDPQAILVRRMIHAVKSDGPPVAVMVETRADMLRILSQLRATELAGGNPWLERILRDACFEHALKGIAATWSPGKEAVIVPVSAASIRTGAFDAFSRRVAQQEQRIFLKFPYEEYLIDPSGFGSMTDGLKARGFSVMIGGIPVPIFATLDLAPANARYLSMNWPEDDNIRLTPALAAALATKLQGMDRTRIILGRCSSRTALEFGKALGLSLFEGSAVSG